MSASVDGSDLPGVSQDGHVLSDVLGPVGPHPDSLPGEIFVSIEQRRDSSPEAIFAARVDLLKALEPMGVSGFGTEEEGRDFLVEVFDGTLEMLRCWQDRLDESAVLEFHRCAISIFPESELPLRIAEWMKGFSRIHALIETAGAQQNPALMARVHREIIFEYAVRAQRCPNLLWPLEPSISRRDEQCMGFNRVLEHLARTVVERMPYYATFMALPAIEEINDVDMRSRTIVALVERLRRRNIGSSEPAEKLALFELRNFLLAKLFSGEDGTESADSRAAIASFAVAALEDRGHSMPSAWVSRYQREYKSLADSGKRADRIRALADIGWIWPGSDTALGYATRLWESGVFSDKWKRVELAMSVVDAGISIGLVRNPVYLMGDLLKKARRWEYRGGVGPRAEAVDRVAERFSLTCALLVRSQAGLIQDRDLSQRVLRDEDDSMELSYKVLHRLSTRIKGFAREGIMMDQARMNLATSAAWLGDRKIFEEALESVTEPDVILPYIPGIIEAWACRGEWETAVKIYEMWFEDIEPSVVAEISDYSRIELQARSTMLYVRSLFGASCAREEGDVRPENTVVKELWLDPEKESAMADIAGLIEAEIDFWLARLEGTLPEGVQPRGGYFTPNNTSVDNSALKKYLVYKTALDVDGIEFEGQAARAVIIFTQRARSKGPIWQKDASRRAITWARVSIFIEKPEAESEEGSKDPDLEFRLSSLANISDIYEGRQRNGKPFPEVALKMRTALTDIFDSIRARSNIALK